MKGPNKALQRTRKDRAAELKRYADEVTMQQSLALYSDDEVRGSSSMDARVRELIGARGPRMGYIASSPDPDRVYFERKRAHYGDLGIDLCVYFDSNAPNPRAALSSLTGCDAIHMTGGNTYTFLHWLRTRGALPVLRQYAREGGMLVGVSAGAILMTPSVSSAELCGDVPFPEPLDDTGMDLVGFQFWPHYVPGAERNSGAAALLKSAPLVYACPDGAGLIVQSGKIERFGDVRILRHGRNDV
ncbi:MAG: Type 1 glutamine amidotransferase-like domain-containing protein [SAR202 cluster bacterium]|jgi:dipeptidase E|nr:Type 1 glutamine amidotransferase-like domain-containing protein [SAR202 cluster bacterium]